MEPSVAASCCHMGMRQVGCGSSALFQVGQTMKQGRSCAASRWLALADAAVPVTGDRGGHCDGENWMTVCLAAASSPARTSTDRSGSPDGRASVARWST